MLPTKRAKLKFVARRRRQKGRSYEKMMKTLLLQNQQIIIQQQNMMFMVMKQLEHPSASHPSSSINNNTSQMQQQQLQRQSSSQLHSQLQQQLQYVQHQQQQQQATHTQSLGSLAPENQNHHDINHNQQSQSSQPQAQSQPLPITHQIHQGDHNNMGSYLTPAASEQDPICDKNDEDDLVALLEGDGMLQHNLLYNPQTDIGPVTPYKSHQQQQQTPSYYSSGCESLKTPRLDHSVQQPTLTNINQNVVKNLADSFKSPTKPKINVQIMSSSSTGSMKNNKAKIIQRMNISEFLRHVHPDNSNLGENNKRSQAQE